MVRIRQVNINSGSFWDDKHEGPEAKQNQNIALQMKRFFDLNFLPTDKEISVLDVACGEMIYVKTYDREKWFQNVEWHGLDISSTAIRKSIGHASRIHGYVANIDKEEIPGVFDYIVSIHSFEHFEDPVGALNKCIKACRERVIICVPYENAWGDDEAHVHKFTLTDPFTGYIDYKILDTNEIFFVFKGEAK